MDNQKIEIRLKSYDQTIIRSSAEQIVDTAKRTGARIKGPVPLPTKKEKVTILVSPHKHSGARDQYQKCTHTRLIIIVDPTDKTVDALMRLNLAVGVNVEITVS